jgi:hypothetical protein
MQMAPFVLFLCEYDPMPICFSGSRPTMMMTRIPSLTMAGTILISILAVTRANKAPSRNNSQRQYGARTFLRLVPSLTLNCHQILPVVHHASALLKDVKIALLSRTSRLARSLPDTLLDDLLDSAPPFAAAVDNLADEIFNSPDILSDLDQSRDKFVRALATVATAVKAFWKGKEDPRPANEKGSRGIFH